MAEWLFGLTLFTALGYGLVAGVFFAFSTFVMRALARLTAPEGVAAMQAINIAVINSLFLAVFLATAATSLALIIAALLRWQEPDAVFLAVGGALYFFGSFLVTMIFNVPKNDALAAIAPADPDSAPVWADYLVTWTLWNHVRTIASLAATASLIIALCR